MNSSTKLLVVIDTNVFISGVFWGGKPQAVIQAWQKNKLVLLLSPYLLAEISTVLERFSASDKQKETITAKTRRTKNCTSRKDDNSGNAS